MQIAKQRCEWVTNDNLYLHYHDTEWGVPTYDERLLFEFLVLEGMQAGLSWLTVLKKREHYRECFDDFDASKIVSYNEYKIAGVLANPGIIRNRLKVASIIANAKAFLQIKDRYGSFSTYIWQFSENEILHNHWSQQKEVPSSTPVAEKMSKDLKKNNFKFVGPTICYAFMQAVGMVNDHLVSCFRFQELLHPPQQR